MLLLPVPKSSSPARALFLSLAFFLIAGSASLAAGPSVTAVLDNAETTLGQPVQLQIKVTGVANATPPGEITVDGLEIRSSGTSRQYEMNNFNVSSSFIFNYTIMPMRAGSFKIPPQTVRVGNSSAKTPELTLTVSDSGRGGSRSAGRRGGAETVGPDKVGFIELILTKTEAYVGEMIPAEVRIGFNAHVPVESLGSNGIQITGQGFTTQKMPEHLQTMETIGGKNYVILTFKTAIAAARPGKIQIGPAEATPVVRIAQQRRSMQNPRDPFGLSDPFFDNFFNDFALAPSTPREVKLTSQATTLDVKPLPPNAPPGFGGAVGIFALKSSVNPKSGQAGDPLTVTAEISGRGNFDSVAAPSFQDDRGWHKYPPSSKFKQDDDVGISGVKTFETVLSANERKDKIPPLEFSFFDPLQEHYVTLHGDALPVQIEGGAAPTATPAPAPPAGSSPNGTISSTVTPAPKQQDILYQMTELSARDESFTPLFARRSFWLAQLIPLVALIGFIAWKIQQTRKDDREAQRIAAFQAEMAELQRRLRREEGTPSEYYAAASRAVQLKTALAKNVQPHVVDAARAAEVFHADESTRRELQELFQRSDELRYSGRQNGAGSVPAAERDRLLALLRRLS